MPQRSIALDSPLVRGAIAAVLLIAVGAAYLLLRDEGDGSGTVVVPPPPGATAMADVEVGPLDDQAPIIGQPAPDFALRDLDGAVVTLSELRGKVVYINFWATWCRPCKKELPDIQAIADEHPEDLVVLAINYRESADEARAYFDENGLRLRVLLDGGGVYEQYKLRGLPDSFFVDRAGNLAEFQIGELSQEKMRERLAEAGLP